MGEKDWLKVTIEERVSLFSTTAAGPDRERIIRILGEATLSAGISKLREAAALEAEK